MRAKGLYVKVEYADQDITAQVEPYLERLEYRDSLGGSQPDTLVVTLDDSQGLFSGPLHPVKGSALYFEFGYDTGDVFKSGKGFLIDSIKIEGGGFESYDPGKLLGTAVWTASANLPGSGIHSRTTRAWTDTTLEGVASEIAEKHGLGLVFESGRAIGLKRLDQFDKTDLGLIKELAERYGLSFSVKAGKEGPTIVIAGLDTIKTKPPVLRLSVGHCTGYSFEDSVRLHPRGRYVRYFDPEKKELVEFGHERMKLKVGDRLTGSALDLPDGTGQQDRAVIREAMQVYAQMDDPQEVECKASIALPGNPNLLAGVVLELPEDEWAYYAGKWVIDKSTHTMDVKSGYKTALELKKHGG